MPMIDSRPPETIYEEIELDNKVNQNPEDTNKERTSKRRCLQKRLFWFIALISILASTAAIAIPLIIFNIPDQTTDEPTQPPPTTTLQPNSATKILISTGWPLNPATKTEVIDLEDSNVVCEDLADFPLE